jgi:hypothetical protein
VKLYTKVEEPAEVRVLLPYLKPNHRLQFVIDGLRIQQVQPELHKVDDGDAYWRLLRDAWAEGREFFVVEHDVFVWQGGIRALAACGEDWCTLPTMCHGRMITTTFGCVKFGQEMVERTPASSMTSRRRGSTSTRTSPTRWAGRSSSRTRTGRPRRI